MENVEFRDIPGWPGYRVGSDGSIWTAWTFGGNHSHIGSAWRVLKGGIDKGGYHKVILCAGGKRRYTRVGVLILETFVGPRPAGFFMCHNDGTRNDALSNLRWDTCKANARDAVDHGALPRGEKCPRHKLTESQVIDAVQSARRGETWQSIADRLGVTKTAIGSIIRGRNWRWLTEQVA